MRKPISTNLESLEAVHTHTHTGSVSGYLAYKKTNKENIKTHVLYMFFNELENI